MTFIFLLNMHGYSSLYLLACQCKRVVRRIINKMMHLGKTIALDDHYELNVRSWCISDTIFSFLFSRDIVRNKLGRSSERDNNLSIQESHRQFFFFNHDNGTYARSKKYVNGDDILIVSSHLYAMPIQSVPRWFTRLQYLLSPVFVEMVKFWFLIWLTNNVIFFFYY